MLDPVAASALCAVLSVIFLTGAWQKLRDPALFQANVENYRLLPDGLAWPAAILLPVWELAAGVLVLFDPTRTAGAVLAIGLLSVVTAAVVINLSPCMTRADASTSACTRKARKAATRLLPRRSGPSTRRARSALLVSRAIMPR